MNVEIIGTIASVIVLLSFLVTDEYRIRIINIYGAALFVVYGVMSGAFSVWLLNGILILVHGWHLLKGGDSNGKRAESSPSEHKDKE